MITADRYTGKPFLRLLDCYFLACIGQLDVDQAQALERAEPKLRQIYGLAGDWQAIVKSVMDFPASMGEQVRSVWAGHLAQAKSEGASVDPNEFVAEFVRQNFPDI
jgi:hypothetical protein